MEESELREQLKAAGVSDEDLEKVGPHLVRALTKSAENMATHRLVFEVVKSRNCLYGVQKGQKIVISGSAIDTDASDCPLCIGRCRRASTASIRELIAQKPVASAGWW
jgi:hypothetical protein